MTRRKRLNTEDMEAIADIIRRQDLLVYIDPEQDKDGRMKFMNTVACRNIREGIFNYLRKHIDPDTVPWNDFAEWAMWGEKNYINEHKNPDK
jgi:hypothetical protein